MINDITFCSKEDNRCKRKMKCQRYIAEHGKDDYVWYSDFYTLFGKECDNFIPEAKSTTRQQVPSVDQISTMLNLHESYCSSTPCTKCRQQREGGENG